MNYDSFVIRFAIVAIAVGFAIGVLLGYLIADTDAIPDNCNIRKVFITTSTSQEPDVMIEGWGWDMFCNPSIFDITDKYNSR